ncbi:hypothetical protein BCR42DRAFT_351921 [Absidia repens]|uniref:DUF4604 domain-containing protein n=1 Tax=Absidia repens TaxID=90262 RepID=A0A1X2IIC6_9FUNG|nr:hypothetical protein BCR42DRAFT_351921 [Absidia repens]
MAPKELTPHQVSKGLSYVHREPAFLARLKGTNKAIEKSKQKFVDYEDGQDDEDYNELDGAQVVELDSKGKEIHKDTETKDDTTEEQDTAEEEVDQGPAVDDNGRLLFRPTKKKKTTLASTKRSLEEAIEDHRKDKNIAKKPKKKSKKQAPLTLSFDPDE